MIKTVILREKPINLCYPRWKHLAILFLLHLLFRKFRESFSTFGQLRSTLAEIDRILRSHLSKCYDLTSNRLHTYTLYRDTHKGWDCIKTTQNSRIMSIWSLSFGFCNSNEYFDGLLKSHPFWVTLYNYIFYNSALCLKHSYFSCHFKFIKLFFVCVKILVQVYWNWNNRIIELESRIIVPKHNIYLHINPSFYNLSSINISGYIFI